jgi:hypothetical protein
VNPQPTFNFAGQFDYCSNEFFTQLALSDSAVLSSVNWYNSSNPGIAISNNFNVSLVGGQYVVEIFDNTGECSNDTTITISMIPSPMIFIDTFACDFAFQVSGTFSSGGGTWSSPFTEISFNDPTLENPLISSSAVGTYTVSYTDNVCNETLQRSIEFIPYPTIFNDTLICSNTFDVVNVTAYNDQVTWDATGPGSINFSPDDATMLASVTFGSPGTYNLVMTDKKCLNSVDANVTVAVQPQIVADNYACNNQFVVTGTVAQGGGQWTTSSPEISFSNANSLNPTISSSASGQFTVYFTDAVCSVTDTLTIDFIANPTVSVIDSVTCSGTAVALTANGNASVDDYLWSTGSSSPSILAELDGDYIVVVSNECGTDADTATISWIPCNINIPNVIVLSSTQGNEALYIDFDGVQEFELTITNRWGLTVFQTTDPTNYWRGMDGSNLLNEGVYSYVLQLTLVNGESLTKQGFINLYH